MRVMTMRDHLIDSLRRLCADKGGCKPVADVIGVDDQSLYQIVSGVKLPSGNPKGVGPKIEKLLTEHFPGWADPKTPPLHAVNEPQPAYGAWPMQNITRAEINSLPPLALAQLERIIRAFLGGPIQRSDWRAVALTTAARLDKGNRADVFTRFVRGVEVEIARSSARPGLPSHAPPKAPKS